MTIPAPTFVALRYSRPVPRTLACLLLSAAMLAALPAAAAGDKAPRQCDTSSFGTPFCATHYKVAIAGLEIGDPASKVRQILGRPTSKRRGNPYTCPFQSGPERYVRPIVKRYRDGLTVKLERHSHSKNICLDRHLNRERTVSEIATTSPLDVFDNGVRVGSTLRATKRAFKPHRIHCDYNKRWQKRNTGQCSIPVRIPRWARRDRAIVALLFEIENRRVSRVRLLLHKSYS